MRESILNLFRPSKKERQLETEISQGMNGKPKSATPARSTPSQDHTITRSHGSDEVDQLRASVVDLDHKLQAITSERDSFKKEFSDYREATQADTRDLEKLNRDLQARLTQTGQMLSAEIASHGQPGPIAELHAEHDEPRGLQRAIAAHKAANQPRQQTLQRP